MTKFLKLTLTDFDRIVLISIKQIDMINQQPDFDGCQIWLQGDTVNHINVTESIEQIEAMIRNEEVVK